MRKMRRIVANTFVTLDGVMQAPGTPEEDPSGGFEHGGWVAPYWDDEANRRMESFMGKPFDLVLGRRTYEIFAAHWPYQHDAAAQALNGAKKYVASRTLKNVAWQNSELLQGDVAEAVARLKAEAGPEIQVHGSGNLLQTLFSAGLVDLFTLWIFPVVVGGGKRLFENGVTPSGLRLVDQAVSPAGVVTCSYEPAGDVPHGSFATQAPSPEELERRRKLAAE